nr:MULTISPECIES: hypothetical protein [unclassified Frankia]
MGDILKLNKEIWFWYFVGNYHRCRQHVDQRRVRPHESDDLLPAAVSGGQMLPRHRGLDVSIMRMYQAFPRHIDELGLGAVEDTAGRRVHSLNPATGEAEGRQSNLYPVEQVHNPVPTPWAPWGTVYSPLPRVHPVGGRGRLVVTVPFLTRATCPPSLSVSAVSGRGRRQVSG